MIANETGAEVERMSFDVHGRRRNVDTWATPATYGIDATTRRGYTGHEQIDGAGLVHMRARMYDPQLGRFIQPDPMVDSDATQGWNRYSYVLNNPLSATDPTGLLKPILANVGAYFAAHVAGGLIAGGIQGGVLAAFTASSSLAIAQYAGHLAAAGASAAEIAVKTTLAHAVVGGIVHELQGGKFGHGFVSSGVTAAFAPALAQLEGTFSGVFVSAILSGTVSKLSGGKFANGAVTAAFAAAFSNLSRKSAAAEMEVGSGDGASGMASVPQTIAVERSGFSTAGDAAKAFGDAYSGTSVTERAEYQTAVVHLGKGNFGYMIPGAGPPGATIVDPSALFAAIDGAGFKVVAWAHTHFDDELMFSGTDMLFVKNINGPLYMTNREGATYRLTPDYLKDAARAYKGVNSVQRLIGATKRIPGERIQ